MRPFALDALLAAALTQDAVVLAPDLAAETLDARPTRPIARDPRTIVEPVTHHDDGAVTGGQTVDLALPGGGGRADARRGPVRVAVARPGLAQSRDLDAGDATSDGVRVTGSDGEGGAPTLPLDLTIEGAVGGPGSLALLDQAIPLVEDDLAPARTFSADDRLEDAEVAVSGRENVEVHVDGHVQRSLVRPDTV